MTTERLRLHRTVVGIIVLASVIGFVAVFAVWAQRQLLETDTWTETSSELLENKDIQEAVANYLVDSLYKNVNVEKELAGALPPRLKPLAGPASGGLRQLADRVALQMLERPRVQLLWEDANRQAHAVLVNIVEGGDETVSTQNGEVSLDLDTLVARVGGQLGVNVAGKLPPRPPTSRFCAPTSWPRPRMRSTCSASSRSSFRWRASASTPSRSTWRGAGGGGPFAPRESGSS